MIHLQAPGLNVAGVAIPGVPAVTAHGIALPEGKGEAKMGQKLGVKDRFELALYGLKNHVEKNGAAAFAHGRDKVRRPVQSDHGPWLRSLMVVPQTEHGAGSAS